MTKINKAKILQQRVLNNTNIVATMGPSCMREDQILRIVEAGAYIFRMNFSHGDYAEKQQMIDAVRAVEKKVGMPLVIFQDLQGPKIRLGKIKEGYAKLKMGQEFILTTEVMEGDEKMASISHPELIKDLEAGKDIYINDGLVKLEITKIAGNKIHTKVKDDGEISTGRGVNFPGTVLSIPAITEKDKKDLKFALGAGIDIVALSFIRTAKEIKQLRSLMEKYGRIVPIIAKIEKWEAIENLDEVLETADLVMVARGDLGVELPIEQVPVVQKKIIDGCKKHNKPVITATQMLISMVDNPTPTRAEVTDVANAIFDGTDAVMLSNETAVGKYPDKAVEMMAKIIQTTEKNDLLKEALLQHESLIEKTTTGAIAAASTTIAKQAKAKLIVCATETGNTAKLISRLRPQATILGLTSNEVALRKMAFMWGVLPVKVKPFTSANQSFLQSVKIAKDLDLVEKDDLMVITSGTITQTSGATNLIKLEKI